LVQITLSLTKGYNQIYTILEIMALQASHASLKVQMNTSAVQERALQTQERKEYFDALLQRWNEWLDNREAVAPDLRLLWGEGIAGGNGVEGG
jgi:hypothetical protein